MYLHTIYRHLAYEIYRFVRQTCQYVVEISLNTTIKQLHVNSIENRNGSNYVCKGHNLNRSK